MAAVLAVVILAFGLAWWRGDRRRWAERLRRGARGLYDVLDSPARSARLFGGSAVVTIGYSTAFAGATLTVIPHTAGLGAALVYLAALPVASLLPVPGGVGVLDTLLVAGALLDGASIVPAIVAVLVFRLITYWLILVPGFFAYGASPASRKRRNRRQRDIGGTSAAWPGFTRVNLFAEETEISQRPQPWAGPARPVVLGGWRATSSTRP